MERGIPSISIVFSILMLLLALVLTGVASAGDTDMDGVADLIDVDDDNDGMLDSLDSTRQVFNFTGSDQLATVPANAVGMYVKVWGAGGSHEIVGDSQAGVGGFTHALFDNTHVTPGAQFSVVVGEGPDILSNRPNEGSPASVYGFGGLGAHDQGGGLSGVFTGTATVTDGDKARALIIAGGGGGYENSGGSPVVGVQSGNGNSPSSGGEASMRGSSDDIAITGCTPSPAHIASAGGGYEGGGRMVALVSPFSSICVSNGDTVAAARGGSGFVAATGVTSSAIEYTADFTASTPPFTGDPDYVAGIGVAGTSASRSGGHGLVVIYWLIDSDGDGVADTYDLDADNDGIADLYEAGNATVRAYDSDGDGYIDASGEGFVDDGMLANSASGNGLDDRIENLLGAAGSGLSPVDSEATPDTVPDYLDLDSDGDGIPDAVEARATANHLQYPGTIDGTADSDNDGILDIFDTGSGAGSTLTAFKTATRPPHADPDDTADALPDYLDTDSDEDTLSDDAEATDLGTPPSAANPDGSITNAASIPSLLGNSDSDDGNSADADFRSLNDADGDTVVDRDEASTAAVNDACLPNTDGTPASKDCDGDGLNVTEEAALGTNTNNPDTDGDGSPDNLDANPTAATAGDDSGNSGTPINILANDNYLADGDSNNSGVTTLAQASGGTCLGIASFDARAGTLLYTPNVGDTGSSCTLNYEVCNNSSGSNVCQTATVTLNLIIDTDGDGIIDSIDLDSDNDAILDSVEGNGDTDGDGVPNSRDLDSANDGIPDLVGSGLSSVDIAALDANNNGRIDNSHGVGSNGLVDSIETGADSGSTDYDGDGSADTPADSDGDGALDFLDLDKDNDGIPNLVEGGLSSAQTNSLDSDGDGRIDPPSQTPANTVSGDGIVNSLLDGGSDKSLNYTAADTDIDRIVDALDLDSDGDGIPDLLESGIAITEADNLDSDDNGRIDPPSQTSANTVGADGIVDSLQGDIEGNPLDTPLLNTDGDTVGDYRDLDSDNDALLDVAEADLPDDNRNGLVDDAEVNRPYRTGDKLLLNRLLVGRLVNANTIPDTDGDGIPDNRELDSDNDGTFDIAEPGVDPALTALDMNRDGVIDGSADPANDPDNDGIYGSADSSPTTFGGLPDSDGDTISDQEEQNGDPNRDTDGDGIPDYLDTDSDNDGFPDDTEHNANCVNADGSDAPNDGDCDNDGVPDRLQVKEVTTAINGIGRVGQPLLLTLLGLLCYRAARTARAGQRWLKSDC